MSILEKLQEKADKVSQRDGSGLGEIIDSNVKKAFGMLSGVGMSTSHIPDNIISFISASGGAGASTIVANVATTLVKKGYSVLVIDANIMYPAQYNYLGYKIETKSVNDIVSFMGGKCAIGDAIRNDKDVSLLAANNRTIMDLISADKMDRVAEYAKALEVLRDFFDIILIDVPNQITLDIVHTSLYSSDTIYLIWDECVDCITNTEFLKRNMMLCGVSYDSKLRLVLNKRTSIQYPRKVVEQLNLDLVSVVPFEVSVIETGLQAGVYVKDGASMSNTATEFVNSINEITERLLHDAGAKVGEGSMDKTEKGNVEEKQSVEGGVTEAVEEDVVEDNVDEPQVDESIQYETNVGVEQESTFEQENTVDKPVNVSDEAVDVTEQSVEISNGGVKK